MNHPLPCDDTVDLGHALHGHGPEKVLVLHDWNGDGTTYDPLRPYLDGTAFTYAFADLRGYGRSMHLAGRHTVAEVSRDILRLADRLEWPTFHVVGHSMTGMAVQRIAVDATQRVRSATAICPVSAAGSPVDDATFEFMARTADSDEHLRRLLRFVSGTLSERWVESKVEHCRRTVSRSCRVGYLSMFTGTDFSAEVAGLPTPFLVVVGDHDPGIDEAAMAKTFLAWHPNAELQVMRDCGHYPMQECPPRLATVLEAHLRRHAGPPPR